MVSVGASIEQTTKPSYKMVSKTEDLRNMVVIGQMPPSMLSSCFAVCEDLHASRAWEVSKSWMFVCVCYPSQATDMPWMWGLLGRKMDTCCCKWWTPGHSCGFYHILSQDIHFKAWASIKYCAFSPMYDKSNKNFAQLNHTATEKPVQYRPQCFFCWLIKKESFFFVVMIVYKWPLPAAFCDNVKHNGCLCHSQQVKLYHLNGQHRSFTLKG